MLFDSGEKYSLHRYQKLLPGFYKILIDRHKRIKLFGDFRKDFKLNRIIPYGSVISNKKIFSFDWIHFVIDYSLSRVFEPWYTLFIASAVNYLDKNPLGNTSPRSFLPNHKFYILRKYIVILPPLLEYVYYVVTKYLR